MIKIMKETDYKLIEEITTMFTEEGEQRYENKVEINGLYITVITRSIGKDYIIALLKLVGDRPFGIYSKGVGSEKIIIRIFLGAI